MPPEEKRNGYVELRTDIKWIREALLRIEKSHEETKAAMWDKINSNDRRISVLSKLAGYGSILYGSAVGFMYKLLFFK